MGYLHIDNLYKNQDILMFKECYALEKIHGTSANVRLSATGTFCLFSGGEKYDNFSALFDHDTLKMNMQNVAETNLAIYGEAYGGKCQGMKATYGNDLRFVAFDVRIGDSWLSVPQAEDVANKCEIPFVDYKRIPTTMEAIDAERDADSSQALRNGMGPRKLREGVVLRPLVEVTLNNGSRIIAKHKRDEFRETASPRMVGNPIQTLRAAKAVALEWVTPMRLRHVVDKLQPKGVEDIGPLISAMIEDVTREAGEEIIASKAVRNKIGTRTATMYKAHLQQQLTEAA
jgi:hypothetical protein